MPNNHPNIPGKIVVVPLSLGTHVNQLTNTQHSCGASNSNSCLLNPVTGNGSCHNHGLVNYYTKLPCNRCNVTPLYVQEICQNRAHGCAITYDKCVKKLTCTNSTCNPCL